MAGPADRDIHLRVVVDEDSKGADRAAASLDRVGRSADKAGHSLGDMSNESKSLGAEIRKTSDHIEKLERQMLQTGDRSLMKAINAERRWLNALKKIPGTDTLSTAPSPLAGLGRLGGVPLPAIVAALTALAAAGPAIGAMLGGLGAGAVGTAGLAAGILSAAQDPRVKSAAQEFGDSISKEFFRGGPAFVDPVIESLGILNAAFQQMKLPEALEQLAPLTTVIAEGFAGFARELTPGLTGALGKMGPFAERAAEGMANMGAAIGHFLDDITASEGAVEGLELAFMVINGTIIMTGSLIRYLSDAFGGLLKVLDNPLFNSLPWLHDLITNLQGANVATTDLGHDVPPAMQEVTHAFDRTSAAAEDLEKGLKAVQDQMSGLIDQQLSFDKSLLEVQKGWAEISKAVMENGTALSGNTEAALANREMFLDRIGDFAQMREEWIGLTGDVAGANDVFQSQIDKLVELGVKAGFSRDVLEALAKNYYVNIVFQAELTRSFQNIGHLIPGYGSQVTEFASGGTTPSGEVFKVGEAGPEYLFSSKQHYVANRQMMSGSGGMGAGAAGDTRVVIDVTGGDEDLKRLIRKWVRIDGPQVIGIS